MSDSSRVDVESSAVRAEIASANTQASIVLAAAAIAAGPLVGGDAGVFDQDWLIMVPTLAGAATAAAALWLLLSVVLPRLDRSGRGSFLTWAQCDRGQLREALASDYQLDELLVLSRIATRKYELLRLAGVLLKIALVFLACAGALSLAF
jgi:hypothetical protein